MTEIQLSLINFPHRNILSTILSNFSDDFEFTANGIFRRITPPLCPECGSPMSHDGYNTYRKGYLGGQLSIDIFVWLAGNRLRRIARFGIN
ncbi:MAG: hypothetical protein WB392_07830 [Methanotrichaceae archaeon]